MATQAPGAGRLMSAQSLLCLLAAFVVGFLIVGTGRFHFYHLQDTASASGGVSAVPSHKLRALINSRQGPVGTDAQRQLVALEVEKATAIAMESLPACKISASSRVTETQCPVCAPPPPSAGMLRATASSNQCPVLPAAETLGGLVAAAARDHPGKYTNVKPPPAPQGAQSGDGPTIQLLSYAGPFGAQLGEQWWTPNKPWPHFCPVNCRRISDRKNIGLADAVMFHGPGVTVGGIPKRGKAGQLMVMTGQESAGYYASMGADSAAYREMDVTQCYQTAIRKPERFRRFLPGDQPPVDREHKTLYHQQFSKWANPGGYWSNFEYGSFAHRRPQMYAKKGFAVWMHNNCNANSRREQVVKHLMPKMPIDSPGKCIHNRDFAGSMNTKDPTTVVAGFKFYISLENVFDDPDWVSSTYFRVLDAGSVPVYMGAPNIEKYSPQPNYVVNMYDFKTPDHLVDYLMYLDANDTAYYERLQWKEEGPSSDFVEFMRLADLHSDCRLCALIALERREQYPRQAQVRLDAFAADFNRWNYLNRRLDTLSDKGTGSVLSGDIRHDLRPKAWSKAIEQGGAGGYPKFAQNRRSDAGVWKPYVLAQKARIAAGEQDVVLGDWADKILALEAKGQKPKAPAWVRGALGSL